MVTLFVIIVCFVIVLLVGYGQRLYLNSLPEDKREKVSKKMTEVRCPRCSSKDFEIVGMRHGKLQYQCKYCKKIK